MLPGDGAGVGAVPGGPPVAGRPVEEVWLGRDLFGAAVVEAGAVDAVRLVAESCSAHTLGVGLRAGSGLRLVRARSPSSGLMAARAEGSVVVW